MNTRSAERDNGHVWFYNDAPLAHDVFVSYLEREFGSVASLDAEAAERAGYNTVAEYKAAIAAQPKTNECPF